MQKRKESKHTPIVTGQLSEELGIVVSKEFIIRTLRVKPFLETKTSAYWDDVPLIRAKLGAYFTRTSRL
jgi:hypothetical protein